MDSFLLYSGFNTGIRICLKNGYSFEFDSDKKNPLDDITIVQGYLYLDETNFKARMSEVKSIECWDNDQQMDDMAYIKFA